MKKKRFQRSPRRQPKKFIVRLLTAPAAPPTFLAAWARGSNQIIGAGVVSR